MTEEQGAYVTEGQNLSTSPDESIQEEEWTPHPLGWEAQEAERIKNLPRDELIRQVNGESDSLLEVVERLAAMVIRWRDGWTKVYIDLAEARQHIAEMEQARIPVTLRVPNSKGD